MRETDRQTHLAARENGPRIHEGGDGRASMESGLLIRARGRIQRAEREGGIQRATQGGNGGEKEDLANKACVVHVVFDNVLNELHVV